MKQNFGKVAGSNHGSTSKSNRRLRRVRPFLLLVVLLSFACGNLPRRYRVEAPPSSSLEITTLEKNSRLNINTASAAELERLPGIGKSLAERIVAHRQSNGNFRRVEHLLMVRGLSARKFREIRPFISLE